jgi:hypothetical protein
LIDELRKEFPSFRSDTAQSYYLLQGLPQTLAFMPYSNIEEKVGITVFVSLSVL